MYSQARLKRKSRHPDEENEIYELENIPQISKRKFVTPRKSSRLTPRNPFSLDTNAENIVQPRVLYHQGEGVLPSPSPQKRRRLIECETPRRSARLLTTVCESPAVDNKDQVRNAWGPGDVGGEGDTIPGTRFSRTTVIALLSKTKPHSKDALLPPIETSKSTTKLPALPSGSLSCRGSETARSSLSSKSLLGMRSSLTSRGSLQKESSSRSVGYGAAGLTARAGRSTSRASSRCSNRSDSSMSMRSEGGSSCGRQTPSECSLASLAQSTEPSTGRRSRSDRWSKLSANFTPRSYGATLADGGDTHRSSLERRHEYSATCVALPSERHLICLEQKKVPYKTIITFKELFDEIDVDQDGVVSAEDVNFKYNSMKWSDTEEHRQMRKLLAVIQYSLTFEEVLRQLYPEFTKRDIKTCAAIAHTETLKKKAEEKKASSLDSVEQDLREIRDFWEAYVDERGRFSFQAFFRMLQLMGEKVTHDQAVDLFDEIAEPGSRFLNKYDLTLWWINYFREEKLVWEDIAGETMSFWEDCEFQQ